MKRKFAPLMLQIFLFFSSMLDRAEIGFSGRNDGMGKANHPNAVSAIRAMKF